MAQLLGGLLQLQQHLHTLCELLGVQGVVPREMGGDLAGCYGVPRLIAAQQNRKKQ